MRPPSTGHRTPEQIDKEYKAILSHQVSIFIEKEYKLIQLHFKQWINKLISFGIATEPPTSSLIANIILGQELSHHRT